MKVKQPKRFWSKVDVGEADECWEWTAGKQTGYGVFKINHRRYFAHRVSWYLAYGKIPKGLCVLHHCDNPSCVNPAHLFLGTQADNMRDASRKGRKGKLTENDVLEIRELQAEGGWTQQEIGDAFGVSRVQISKIMRGRNWAWL